VFSLSYVIGETMVAMAKSNDISLSLSVHSISYNVTTANVIAETNFGSAENVIVVG
jgi:hypothetical protein